MLRHNSILRKKVGNSLAKYDLCKRFSFCRLANLLWAYSLYYITYMFFYRYDYWNAWSLLEKRFKGKLFIEFN